jgi:hypothetical protein
LPLLLERVAENGVYRFRFTLSQDPYDTTFVPLAFRLSNWFEVTN